MLALMLSISLGALAQNLMGGINGTVTDPSGAVIPGAMVTATNTDTGVCRNLTTRNLGKDVIRVLSDFMLKEIAQLC
jgi:hypothetical protein